MKNINLENAWCKTTQENYDALINLDYKPSDNITNAFIKDFETHLRIEGDTIIWGHKKCIGAMKNPDYWSKDREIHLVNGEFQYVETKPKNNFKDYGFEADFEGEILKEVKELKGIEYLGYFVGDNKTHYPCIWTKSGRIWKTSVSEKDRELYNLKPIKKEWYENPDNFPAVMINIKTEKPHIVYAYKDGRFQTEIFTVKFNKYRLATKEEVLSLLVKE